MFLSKVFPLEIVSALVVLILILNNGGFHLDGLADTFDALAVKSSGDEKLTGEKARCNEGQFHRRYRVVSITLTILMKYLFIKDLFLINASLPAVLSILFLMPVFSEMGNGPQCIMEYLQGGMA